MKQTGTKNVWAVTRHSGPYRIPEGDYHDTREAAEAALRNIRRKRAIGFLDLRVEELTIPTFGGKNGEVFIPAGFARL